MLVPSVDAGKKGKNTIASIKDRIGIQKDVCELIGGGTLTVKDSPFVPNKITTCDGGTEGGTRCTHTPKKTTCSQTLTGPSESGPAAPPTEGVNEVPTGGDNTVGSPASGQVAVQAEEAGQHDEDGRNSKRKHRRHGG